MVSKRDLILDFQDFAKMCKNRYHTCEKQSLEIKIPSFMCFSLKINGTPLISIDIVDGSSNFKVKSIDVK